MTRFARTFASIAFGVIASLPAVAAEPPDIGPVGDPLVVDRWDKDGISDFSGVACGVERDGRRNCVIVDDEQRRLGFVTIAGSKIELVAEMAVLDKTTTNPASGATVTNKEADLEAVARDGDGYWVFGSHGTKRRPEPGMNYCPLQPGRRHLYYFAVDPKTDLPAFTYDRSRAVPAILRIDRLPAVLAKATELTELVDAPICGDDGGFTIEGGAVSGGKMMLGVRAPLVDDGTAAMIVELDSKALAEGADVTPKVHRVALGKDMGVRDLAAVSDGHLILAGPSGSDDGGSLPKSTVWFWPKDATAAIPLAALVGLPVGAKPEGMAVLTEDKEGWSVLILADNVSGGAPRVYRIARR